MTDACVSKASAHLCFEAKVAIGSDHNPHFIDAHVSKVATECGQLVSDFLAASRLFLECFHHGSRIVAFYEGFQVKGAKRVDPAPHKRVKGAGHRLDLCRQGAL